jgi:uncharacterized protein YyaL (SSP411 family)
MIHGLIRAARVFDRPDWLAAATRALDFIRSTLWRNGRLLATCKDGRAHLDAYLDDHAFLINALVESLQAGYRAEDLEFAEDLADAMLDDFQDQAGGGFYFTRHDHETLIHRPKGAHDSAMPSGNGIAAQVLGRLAHLTGETRYLAAAERTLQAYYPALRASPGGYASIAVALAEQLAPPPVVVLRGPVKDLPAWQRKLAALSSGPACAGTAHRPARPAARARQTRRRCCQRVAVFGALNACHRLSAWTSLEAELIKIGKPAWAD